MSNLSTKYVVVTPVRDEEAYLPFTIESMVRQTVRPSEWIIVDDGSKDRTGEIIDEAARQYSWIRRCNRTDRGYRKPGAGIIEAFYAGYDVLNCKDWQYMAKLDGDLSFAPTYFEEILSRFQNDSKLGIAGGTLYHITDGRRELETCPTFHVRGGAKIFRRACWDAIQGLWVGYGSDTIDEVQANMLGWKTMSMADLLMQHHRFTGATYGRWGALVKDGKGDYASGYHPLFLIAKCIRRIPRKPALMGAAGLMYGYLISYLQRLPRVNSQVRKYIRQEQLARLTGRPSIWK